MTSESEESQNLKEASNDTAEKEVQKETLSFSWATGQNELWRSEGVGLSPDSNQVYAFVVFREPLPQLPQEYKDQLAEYENLDGEKVFYKGFGEFDLERASKLTTGNKPSLTHHKLASRKSDELITPVEVTIKETAETLSTRRVLVYTGAGISVAAGAPDMPRLMRDLGIERSETVDIFIRDVFEDNDNLKRRVASIQAGFFENATEAHLALAELQKVCGFKVATENLDYLHEAAGTKPIKRGQINEEITDDVLRETDVIVTVGLRADDSGLMYRYREVNPQGKFLALNLTPPPYLENGDYFLKGDVQRTLPEILKQAQKS